jgi:putative tricarboxylic transport membrane protein
MPPVLPASRHQQLIGAGAFAVGAVLAYGAWFIPAQAGYAGVGPNFLPWVVALVLLLCGALLFWQAGRGGWHDVEVPSGAATGDWPALAWVSGGVLAIALLIERIGFVFACTLGFALAVRGLRTAEGRPGGGVATTLIDLLTGLAIAAPVYWMFTKVLAINLPGLTGTGWL